MSFKMGKVQGSPFYEHKLDTAVAMEKIRFSSSLDRFFKNLASFASLRK